MGDADPPEVREFRVILPINRPGSTAPITRDMAASPTSGRGIKTNSGGNVPPDDQLPKTDLMDSNHSPSAAQAELATDASAAAAETGDTASPRLMSLDAYRGFIMIAMASAGLGFSQIAKNEAFMHQWGPTFFGRVWRFGWGSLAYQFEHVPWAGCSFWDLIQPSFMFMVGVALPFSNARRQALGQSSGWRWLHVFWRAAVLVLLGLFLSSTAAPLTNFTFVNVLTQIGLGYVFLYYLSDRSVVGNKLLHTLLRQGLVAVLILIAYWSWFASFSMSLYETRVIDTILIQHTGKPASDWYHFPGFSRRWNKHLNAAANFDRRLLNKFPRTGDEIATKKFWFNEGGYQTTNFIPSLSTMILGLMAGTILCSALYPHEKLSILLWAGVICFALVLPFDTYLWPSWMPRVAGVWSICPTVKRIWTPTWTLFSAGWTFFILSAFYWVIDIRGYRAWARPLVIVGMNSIAMYLMSQLCRPFVRSSLKTHLATVDTLFGWQQGLVYNLIGDGGTFAPLFERVLILLVFWCVCYWMYQRKVFIRI